MQIYLLSVAFHQHSNDRKILDFLKLAQLQRNSANLEMKICHVVGNFFSFFDAFDFLRKLHIITEQNQPIYEEVDQTPTKMRANFSQHNNPIRKCVFALMQRLSKKSGTNKGHSDFLAPFQTRATHIDIYRKDRR